MFYAKNINVVPGQKDTITVTYSGSATTSGCVFVEYQGADTLAPLDSVSEAISNATSPSNALDSGTASPANASLLVFGSGVNDGGSSRPSSAKRAHR
jgi:hypothetical protein